MNFDSAAESAIELFRHLEITLPTDTPERFVKMLAELTAYNNVSNREIATRVNKMFDLDEKTSSEKIIVVKNIDAFSLCEHHIALMYDMKVSIAYVPHGKVIGLSKIVRLVDMVCKRLQLQEKIGEDITEIMSVLNKSSDVAVHIAAKHSCVTARGTRNPSAETVAVNFSGAFKQNLQMQQNFLMEVRG